MLSITFGDGTRLKAGVDSTLALLLGMGFIRE